MSNEQRRRNVKLVLTNVKRSHFTEFITFSESANNNEKKLI